MKSCLACCSTFAGPVWRCPHCGAAPAELDGFVAFAPGLASGIGFKDGYFHELLALEARNFWFRARNRLLTWALARYFPDAMTMLEIGCGTGFALAAMATAHPKLTLAGSEISTVGLACAAERAPGIDLYQMDARAIPFANEFDVIGAFDVLEHIEEDTTALSEMYRAVCPGGGVLLTVPQHPSMWSPADEYARHVRRYAAGDLRAKVSAAGFRVERMTSFMSLLAPLMWASRARARMIGAQYDPLAELSIGGLANAALERVSALERLAIRGGINFPLGGSLLLVARKAS